MHEDTDTITSLILEAAGEARREAGDDDAPFEPRRVNWPVSCTVGPGLEGAIACETRIGYVNGSRGQLVYQGYDIFDLCAYSTYEECCYLLLHGKLPTAAQMEAFNQKLARDRRIPNTLRRMMSVPIEDMQPMAALRLASNFMRQRLTWRDSNQGRPSLMEAIAADEDSIAMETVPRGQRRAAFEFGPLRQERPQSAREVTDDAQGLASCIHLISGMATLAAAICRLRAGMLPIEPDPSLGHAANLLYMMTGRHPTPEQARIMDVALILHADHGMNASTFASMVVASTMSDIYFSIGAGIAALNGPLHGGANEQVIHQLREIGGPEAVDAWYAKSLRQKRRVMGFGHRVYRAYDPRARILAPLAARLATADSGVRPLYETARRLEAKVIGTLGVEKGIFPNVDFYSGLVYTALGIPAEMFTPLFAVSRVAGWTARVLEYLKKNRIFRPRAWYVGNLGERYVPIDERGPRPRR